jgi:membrane protein implicated in regulation of membrane protease activity
MHPLDILFWSCLMLGGAYTLITLLMGGLSHAHHVGDALHVSDLGGHHHADFGHVDAGHVHAGHVDVHAGHAHGDAHHADHHADTSESGGRLNLLQYLNPMSVAGFLLGFGGVGIICRNLGLPPPTSLVCGLAAGSGLWLMAYLLVTRMFGAAEGTSHNRREDLIGYRAQVTAPIAGQRPGMVAYTVAGSRQSLRAVTDDEEPIPNGAVVRIRRIEGSTAHVVRIDTQDNTISGRI